MKICIAVITNKPKLSDLFLSHLLFSDEILIGMDGKILPSKGSSDKKIKYFKLEPGLNFSEKRNKLLSISTSEWVFFVDDDEIVSKNLALEITRLPNNKSISGYFLRRIDVCFYQEIKHGEVASQYLLRLAKKSSGQFSRNVHETWEIKGRVSYLNNPLYHQKDDFITQFLPKIISYGVLDVASLREEKKTFSWLRLITLPPLKFFQNYFFKLGFLDGYAGLFLNYLMSVQSLSVRVLQWEKK
mgnify:CR=1 FL=1